jgi:hypothetical protein
LRTQGQEKRVDHEIGPIVGLLCQRYGVNRIERKLDKGERQITVVAGIERPELIEYLVGELPAKCAI